MTHTGEGILISQRHDHPIKLMTHIQAPTLLQVHLPPFQRAPISIPNEPLMALINHLQL